MKMTDNYATADRADLKAGKYYRLRSEPETVYVEHSKEDLRLDEEGKPFEFMVNDYVNNGDGTVLDRATGLMWQQGGSDRCMSYDRAQSYVKQLNRERYAGYGDWRLPTVPELMSLLEPEKMNGELSIDPVFSGNQKWCWSADLEPGCGPWGAAWIVFYKGCKVYELCQDIAAGYVRAVRTWP